MAIALDKAHRVETIGRRALPTSTAPEVQIALLSAQINVLVKRLQRHRENDGLRRKLLEAVCERRRLLMHLAATDSRSYHRLIRRLGLRR
jgi:ribosomal protein S15